MASRTPCSGVVCLPHVLCAVCCACVRVCAACFLFVYAFAVCMCACACVCVCAPCVSGRAKRLGFKAGKCEVTLSGPFAHLGMVRAPVAPRINMSAWVCFCVSRYNLTWSVRGPSHRRLTTSGSPRSSRPRGTVSTASASLQPVPAHWSSPKYSGWWFVRPGDAQQLSFDESASRASLHEVLMT